MEFPQLVISIIGGLITYLVLLIQRRDEKMARRLVISLSIIYLVIGVALLLTSRAM